MDRMLRPEATVLPDSAQIPPENLIQPPPTHFTHVLKSAQDYYYRPPTRKSAAPDGVLAAGTKLLLISCDKAEHWCRVADERGLHVVIAKDSLDAAT